MNFFRLGFLAIHLVGLNWRHSSWKRILQDSVRKIMWKEWVKICDSVVVDKAQCQNPSLCRGRSQPTPSSHLFVGRASRTGLWALQDFSWRSSWKFGGWMAAPQCMYSASQSKQPPKNPLLILRVFPTSGYHDNPPTELHLNKASLEPATLNILFP